jgi:hypothetical protein
MAPQSRGSESGRPRSIVESRLVGDVTRSVFVTGDTRSSRESSTCSRPTAASSTKYADYPPGGVRRRSSPPGNGGRRPGPGEILRGNSGIESTRSCIVKSEERGKGDLPGSRWELHASTSVATGSTWHLWSDSGHHRGSRSSVLDCISLVCRSRIQLKNRRYSVPDAVERLSMTGFTRQIYSPQAVRTRITLNVTRR